jgi:hypothetical protein
MLGFDLHPFSLPALKPMSTHPLWEFWDLVLDFSITMNQEQAFGLIFSIFFNSFAEYPRPGYFPLFAFMLKIPSSHERAAEVLLDYADSDEVSAEEVGSSAIPRAIIELSKPSSTALLVLAKAVSSKRTSPFEQATPVRFSGSGHVDILSAGMLALCCVIANQWVPSFNRLKDLCVQHCFQCAPYASLLFGLVLDKAGSLLVIQSFHDKFQPLLQSERSDVRLATAFCFGCCRNEAVCPILERQANDEDPNVRVHVLWGLIKLGVDTKTVVEMFIDDQDEMVRSACTDIRNGGEGRVQGNAQEHILGLLLRSVSAPGFRARMKYDIFASPET